VFSGLILHVIVLHCVFCATTINSKYFNFQSTSLCYICNRVV